MTTEDFKKRWVNCFWVAPCVGGREDEQGIVPFATCVSIVTSMSSDSDGEVKEMHECVCGMRFLLLYHHDSNYLCVLSQRIVFDNTSGTHNEHSAI